MKKQGQELLQGIANRIVRGYLLHTGATGVMFVDESDDASRFKGVDLVYSSSAGNVKAKVKPDSYFGVDPRKIADQNLTFYRNPTGAYAFETISHHLTREPGWVVDPMADELYYYFLALGQPEDELSVLLEEPDEVFFSELAVERDELHVLPMKALGEWSAAHSEDYMPRPVTVGSHSAWYRIVPTKDLAGTPAAADVRGSIFALLAKR